MPAPARAYTISSVVSPGCHERITSDALRAVRLHTPLAGPIAADRNDQALISDLEFSLPSDMTDLGAATLLVGVRDNDLLGRDSNDVTQLALVHGDPAQQRNHCLRNSGQKEPGGSQTAVTDCQAFILERVGQALAGLDANGKPDPTNRTALPLFLSLRHSVTASLPTYYVRLGQALHAVEDSFTHTYRTPDGMKITTVLDWVDEANGTLNEATDGPPHASELDRCDDPDDLRRRRRELATEAVTAMLGVTLDSTQTAAQKMTAVQGLLTTYLSYSPGCTFDNGWCQAPEHALGNGSALGCSAAGASGSGGGWGRGCGWTTGLMTLFGVLVVFGRRPKNQPRRAHLGLPLALVVTAAIFAPATAAASDAAASAAAQPPPPVTNPIKEPGPADPSQLAWGVYAGGSASISYEAVAAALGARLRVSRRWTFGLDAEWNPWIAVNGTRTARAGAFNGYATAIVKLPLAYEKFNLRITGEAGMSRLLIDLYGAPKGSTGLFVGLNPLGLEWKMSKAFYLIVNPLGVAIPIPQLKGVPYAYPQYRATVGLEFY